MGSFLGQVTQEGILSIKLELEGKASNIKDLPLMASALVGILEPSSVSVNNINSSSVASSRGISLSTSRRGRSALIVLPQVSKILKMEIACSYLTLK